jgi:hypothetical protein
VDSFSGFARTIPITGKTHDEVSRAFKTVWICLMGTPSTLVSDNEFDSAIFNHLTQGMQIKHVTTPFYNPRSNGIVERFFGSLKRLFRAAIRGLYQNTWDLWVAPLTFALNITVHSATGISPHAMVFGHEANTPLTSLVGFPEETVVTAAQHMSILSNNFVRMFLKAETNLDIYQRRIGSTYTQKSPLEGLDTRIGSLVHYWTPYRKKGTSGALSSRWTGPWKIIDYKPPQLITIKSQWYHLKDGERKEVVRDTVEDRCVPFRGEARREDVVDLDPDDIPEQDIDEMAEDPRPIDEDVSYRKCFLIQKRSPRTLNNECGRYDMVDDVTPNDQPLTNEERSFEGDQLIRPSRRMMTRSVARFRDEALRLETPIVATQDPTVNYPEVQPEDIPLPATPERPDYHVPPEIFIRRGPGRPRKNPPPVETHVQTDEFIPTDTIPTPAIRPVRVNMFHDKVEYIKDNQVTIPEEMSFAPVQLPKRTLRSTIKRLIPKFFRTAEVPEPLFPNRDHDGPLPAEDLFGNQDLDPEDAARLADHPNETGEESGIRDTEATLPDEDHIMES